MKLVTPQKKKKKDYTTMHLANQNCANCKTEVSFSFAFGLLTTALMLRASLHVSWRSVHKSDFSLFFC